MSNPCNSCAFSPGALANTEIYNRLRSQICALTGVPFWCHHAANGTDLTSNSKFVTKGELREREFVICEGWKREVQKHVKPGLEGTSNRLVQRWKGEYILMLIEEYVDTEDPTEKTEVLKRLDRSIRRLHAEDGFTEVVA